MNIKEIANDSINENLRTSIQFEKAKFKTISLMHSSVRNFPYYFNCEIDSLDTSNKLGGEELEEYIENIQTSAKYVIQRCVQRFAGIKYEYIEVSADVADDGYIEEDNMKIKMRLNTTPISIDYRRMVDVLGDVIEQVNGMDVYIKAHRVSKMDIYFDTSKKSVATPAHIYNCFMDLNYFQTRYFNCEVEYSLKNELLRISKVKPVLAGMMD
ncbi:hypothetical protein [Bacillus mycoides]|uniref:hypothetical protein n=1 Tax=Bacillus mycoides TaxID=1405 RepID=UPI0010BE2285|nr:hypothetical protein [Bacillus mycoides]TKI39970.1 hypothetical protein FC700_20880 [Bacillus mycoides]